MRRGGTRARIRIEAASFFRINYRRKAKRKGSRRNLKDSLYYFIACISVYKGKKIKLRVSEKSDRDVDEKIENEEIEQNQE